MKRERFFWKAFEVCIFLALLLVLAMMVLIYLARYWGQTSYDLAAGAGILAVFVVGVSQIFRYLSSRKKK